MYIKKDLKADYRCPELSHQTEPVPKYVMEMLQSTHILQTLDRLISEMNTLRRQVVASLENSSTKTMSSVREAEYFGMWANREDMPEGSSRAWLEQLRLTQWHRSL